jgi:hypothetical protein
VDVQADFGDGSKDRKVGFLGRGRAGGTAGWLHGEQPGADLDTTSGVVGEQGGDHLEAAGVALESSKT